MFFVDIYVITLFIFSVSTLIILQTMFLSNGKVIFFPSIIFFKLSELIFGFCVSICSVVLGCVVFLFSEVDGSFQFDRSWLLLLSLLLYKITNIGCKWGSYPPCLVRARVGYTLPLYTNQSHTWHRQKGWPFYYHFSEQNTRVAWQLRF